MSKPWTKEAGAAYRLLSSCVQNCQQASMNSRKSFANTGACQCNHSHTPANNTLQHTSSPESSSSIMANTLAVNWDTSMPGGLRVCHRPVARPHTGANDGPRMSTKSSRSMTGSPFRMPPFLPVANIVYVSLVLLSGPFCLTYGRG